MWLFKPFASHRLANSMGTHCHQVLAFSTTMLAAELQLLPPLAEKRQTMTMHDQQLCLWHLQRYTLGEPNETKSQFHQRCSETSLKTHSILFFSFNTQLQSLAGHSGKQTKEGPCNLQKAATGLVVYDHPSQHPWRGGGANSAGIKPSFSSTANQCFTEQASQA